MRNDADGHELLAVVAAVHHERVGEALNDGAVGLAEPLRRILARGVGDVDGVAEGDVVAEQSPQVSHLEPKVHPSKRRFPFASRISGTSRT